MTRAIVKKEVTHQNIGGKEIIIDEKISEDLTPLKVFTEAKNGNIACFNFILRRDDFNPNFPHKIFYGKVGGLGYIVSNDELEFID